MKKRDCSARSAHSLRRPCENVSAESILPNAKRLEWPDGVAIQPWLNGNKKIWITFVAILSLLCGCQANENTNASDYGDDIAKAQEIAVVCADTSEVLETITSKDEIERFVLSLDLEQWKLKTLPDNVAEIGSFNLAQEETIKPGQADTDGTLYDIAAITLYDGAYVSFEIGGFDMTFEVSEETADYLNRYFE